MKERSTTHTFPAAVTSFRGTLLCFRLPFPKNFSPSVLSQSVSRCLGFFFFSFLFTVTAAIPPPQKNPTCSRESFMQRDSPHGGRSELIRRITCRSRPPRGSRGAAAISHRSPACRKDSSSGLLTVRLPPSAEEDCGSITHHRAAHRHRHTHARTQPLHTLNAVGKLLKPPQHTPPTPPYPIPTRSRPLCFLIDAPVHL